MKFIKILKWLPIYSTAVLASACSQQQVHLQTVYSSNDCGIKDQTIKQINTSLELDEILRPMRRNFSRVPVVLPEVDYDKQDLILYALGQKPTAGYAIELYKDEARIEKQTLYLPVRLQRPEAGSMQAQVITSPCQIYSLPQADYAKIVVEDILAD
jgi:hypothetical protein